MAQNNIGRFVIFRLIAVNYWKHKINLFTNFILPIILATILLFTIGKNIPIKLIDFYAGLIITPLFTVCLIAFPISYLEWKKSSLIKVLVMQGIGVISVLILFGLFFLLISILSTLFIVSYCLIFDQYIVKKAIGSRFYDFFEYVDWFWFITGFVLLNVTLITTGYFITFLTNKPKNILPIGLSLYLIQAFFLGCYIPLRFTIKSEYLRFFSYFFPGFGPTRIIQAAFLPKFSNDQELIQAGLGHWPYLQSDWKMVILINNKWIRETNLISFNNQYYVHALLGVGWTICLGGASVLLQKKQRV